MTHSKDIWLMPLILLLVGACSNDDHSDSSSSSGIAGAVTAEEETYQWYNVGPDGARLRQTAGPEGRIIEQLPGGARVADLNELSPFLTSIELAEVRFDEPWWRVRTTTGKEGWIFGAALTGVDSATLLRKRTEALFGKEMAERLSAYRGAQRQARTATEVAQCYRQGLGLREELLTRMEAYLGRHPGQTLPDLFWLSGALPAFIPQLVAEKTSYYLFADYRAWSDLAGQSTGKEDDYFFQLCIRRFPTDSIEYFYPAWTIGDGQPGPPGGHSLLGRGIHRRMLQAIEQTLRLSNSFRPEIEAMKQELINDIVHPHVTYWEETDSISTEIERILSDSIACLSGDERVALHMRLQQIQSDSVNLQTNYKNGAPPPQ